MSCSITFFDDPPVPHVERWEKRRLDYGLEGYDYHPIVEGWHVADLKRREPQTPRQQAAVRLKFLREIPELPEGFGWAATEKGPEFSMAQDGWCYLLTAYKYKLLIAPGGGKADRDSD